MKMWALNQARQNGDCKAIADEINSWMPPEAQCVEACDVAKALGRINGSPTVNIALLRGEIDKMPHLYSARLNGDYQAILNEVLPLPGLRDATLVDVIEAMAHAPVPQPENVVRAKINPGGFGKFGSAMPAAPYPAGVW